jgi:hypothetical protein
MERPPPGHFGYLAVSAPHVPAPAPSPSGRPPRPEPQWIWQGASFLPMRDQPGPKRLRDARAMHIAADRRQPFGAAFEAPRFSLRDFAGGIAVGAMLVAMFCAAMAVPA